MGEEFFVELVCVARLFCHPLARLPPAGTPLDHMLANLHHYRLGNPSSEAGRRRGGTRGGPGLAGSPGPVERPGPGPCSDEHWAAPRNHTSKPLNPCPRERTSLLADTPLQVQVVAQFPIRRESGGSAPSRSAADALRQRPPDQLPDRGLRLTLETGQKGG
jgi:hypothetical protein